MSSNLPNSNAPQSNAPQSNAPQSNAPRLTGNEESGILNVVNPYAGASWFTMKFKRRDDALKYAEKRNREDKSLHRLLVDHESFIPNF